MLCFIYIRFTEIVNDPSRLSVNYTSNQITATLFKMLQMLKGIYQKLYLGATKLPFKT